MNEQEILINEMFSPFLSALLGALVGGLFALMGVAYAHSLTLKRDQGKEDNLILSFKRMIKTEIKVLWSRYQTTIGIELEELREGQPLLSSLIFDGNYFVVYDNNSQVIGKLNDCQLSEKIVSVYTSAKGLLNLYQINNGILAEYAEFMFENHVAKKMYSSNVNVRERHLLDKLKVHTKQLKEDHSQLKVQIEDLLRSLE